MQAERRAYLGCPQSHAFEGLTQAVHHFRGVRQAHEGSGRVAVERHAFSDQCPVIVLVRERDEPSIAEGGLDSLAAFMTLEMAGFTRF